MTTTTGNGKKNYESKTFDYEGVTISTIKQFRAIPDVENFYRFIHENDLRRECHILFEKMFNFLKTTKAPKKKK